MKIKNPLKKMFRSKKGIDPPIILVLTVVLCLMSLYYQINEKIKHTATLGEVQSDVMGQIFSGEDYLLYLKQSAKYSGNKALVDLYNKGGIVGKSPCGILDGYNMWNKVVGDKETNCIPKKYDMLNGFLNSFSKSFEPYVDKFNTLKISDNIIAKDDYFYTITKEEDGYSLNAFATTPLHIPILGTTGGKIGKFLLTPSFSVKSVLAPDLSKDVSLVLNTIRKECSRVKDKYRCAENYIKNLNTHGHTWSVRCGKNEDKLLHDFAGFIESVLKSEEPKCKAYFDLDFDMGYQFDKGVMEPGLYTLRLNKVGQTIHILLYKDGNEDTVRSTQVRNLDNEDDVPHLGYYHGLDDLEKTESLSNKMELYVKYDGNGKIPRYPRAIAIRNIKADDSSAVKRYVPANAIPSNHYSNHFFYLVKNTENGKTKLTFMNDKGAQDDQLNPIPGCRIDNQIVKFCITHPSKISYYDDKSKTMKNEQPTIKFAYSLYDAPPQKPQNIEAINTPDDENSITLSWDNVGQEDDLAYFGIYCASDKYKHDLDPRVMFAPPSKTLILKPGENEQEHFEIKIKSDSIKCSPTKADLIEDAKPDEIKETHFVVTAIDHGLNENWDDYTAVSATSYDDLAPGPATIKTKTTESQFMHVFKRPDDDDKWKIEFNVELPKDNIDGSPIVDLDKYAVIIKTSQTLTEEDLGNPKITTIKDLDALSVEIATYNGKPIIDPANPATYYVYVVALDEVQNFMTDKEEYNPQKHKQDQDKFVTGFGSIVDNHGDEGFATGVVI